MRRLSHGALAVMSPFHHDFAAAALADDAVCVTLCLSRGRRLLLILVEIPPHRLPPALRPSRWGWGWDRPRPAPTPTVLLAPVRGQHATTTSPPPSSPTMLCVAKSAPKCMRGRSRAQAAVILELVEIAPLPAPSRPSPRPSP